MKVSAADKILNTSIDPVSVCAGVVIEGSVRVVIKTETTVGHRSCPHFTAVTVLHVSRERDESIRKYTVIDKKKMKLRPDKLLLVNRSESQL